jgi:hypothetical protein
MAAREIMSRVLLVTFFIYLDEHLTASRQELGMVSPEPPARRGLKSSIALGRSDVLISIIYVS